MAILALLSMRMQPYRKAIAISPSVIHDLLATFFEKKMLEYMESNSE